MPEYNLTPTEYSKYYATLPRRKGARGRVASGEGPRAAEVINKKIVNGDELPGVLSIKTIGRQRLLRVSKRVYDTYQNIIS